MITRTPKEEAREARESLAKYGHVGTPAQVAAVTLALDAGARVLFVTHPTLGGLSFLVYRPVPANVEDALNALARRAPTTAATAAAVAASTAAAAPATGSSSPSLRA